MIYSVAEHGAGTSAYDGGIYLKEAVHSRSRDAYTKIDPLHRSVRQFLFVGIDFCYETIGFEDPIIEQFESREAAYLWRLDAQDGLEPPTALQLSAHVFDRKNNLSPTR
ncbi:MAG TPA: hypothetical protein VK801_16385 [Caulobacteraceae bacterium]|nr:hypothetical protein [Caulobacteraceae bacterium]